MIDREKLDARKNFARPDSGQLNPTCRKRSRKYDTIEDVD